MVEVKLYQEMRKIVGDNKVIIKLDGTQSVEDILQELIQSYSSLKDKIFEEKGKLNSYINVFVNGRNIMTKEGLDTKVKDGDRIALFPPLGGG